MRDGGVGSERVGEEGVFAAWFGGSRPRADRKVVWVREEGVGPGMGAEGVESRGWWVEGLGYRCAGRDG